MLGLSRLGNSLARRPPDPVARRAPAPDLQHAGGADRPRRAAGRGAGAPEDLEFLAAIYAFGATLAFTLVHLSVIRLRFREPDRDRPYRSRSTSREGRPSCRSPRCRGGAWRSSRSSSVLVLHDAARWVGVGWMAVRRAALRDLPAAAGKPVFKRVTVPADALTRREVGGGVRLDPRAGARHAARRRHHADGGRLAGRGARRRRRGRRARSRRCGSSRCRCRCRSTAASPTRTSRRAQGARAGEGGGGGVRGRRGRHGDGARAARGRGDRARGQRRGVEAIVMPAEEPTGIRGGLWLGGGRACRRRSWGRRRATCSTRRRCRVILTAPPRRRVPHARRARAGEPPERRPRRPSRGRRTGRRAS